MPAFTFPTTLFVAGFTLLTLPSTSFETHTPSSCGSTQTEPPLPIVIGVTVFVAGSQVCTAPADGVRGPDGLEWIPNQDGTVTLIDPASNKVVDTVHSRGVTFVVRNGFGSVWVDDFNGTTLARYRTAP